MIQKLSHASIYVLDQDAAKTFYTEKLGFEVKMDVTLGNFRWLTVAPKGQQDLEIILMPVGAMPNTEPEIRESMIRLLAAGKMPGGVFYTADCRATYEELKAKGVEFVQPPVDRPYGVEAVLKDPFGNWFSMTQPKPMPSR